MRKKITGLYVLHLIPCETIWKEGDLMERIYLDHVATSPTHPYGRKDDSIYDRNIREPV